jgi:hypothetical protein
VGKGWREATPDRLLESGQGMAATLWIEQLSAKAPEAFYR